MQFRGQPVSVVKTAKKVLTSELSQCFTSGAGPNATHTLNMYRADVLRLLPEQLDVDDKTTGRRLVNDVDLLNAGLQRHTVRLPEAGNGNQAPQSAGASLFVVYRDLGRPLTKIVVYDGAYARPMGVKMTQTLRGFLKSSANPQAKLTHIVGTGGPSKFRSPVFQEWRQAHPPVVEPRPAHEPGLGSRLEQPDLQRAAV